MEDGEEAPGSYIGMWPYSCFPSGSWLLKHGGPDGCWPAARADGAFPQQVNRKRGQHGRQTWGNTVTAVGEPGHTVAGRGPVHVWGGRRVQGKEEHCLVTPGKWFITVSHPLYGVSQRHPSPPP